MSAAIEIIAGAVFVGLMGLFCAFAVIANLSKDITEKDIEAWLRKR